MSAHVTEFLNVGSRRHEDRSHVFRHGFRAMGALVVVASVGLEAHGIYTRDVEHIVEGVLFPVFIAPTFFLAGEACMLGVAPEQAAELRMELPTEHET